MWMWMRAGVWKGGDQAGSVDHIYLSSGGDIGTCIIRRVDKGQLRSPPPDAEN